MTKTRRVRIRLDYTIILPKAVDTIPAEFSPTTINRLINLGIAGVFDDDEARLNRMVLDKGARMRVDLGRAESK